MAQHLAGFAVTQAVGALQEGDGRKRFGDYPRGRAEALLKRFKAGDTRRHALAQLLAQRRQVARAQRLVARLGER